MKAIGLRMGVCALAIVALVGCASTGGGGGVSDEQLIENLVIDAMAALQAGDIDAMVANYADSFESDQGGGRDETKEFLQGAKDQGFLDEVEVDLSNMEVTVEGNKASAKPIDLEGAFGAITLEFELEKIDGQWKVTYQSQY